MKNQPDTVCITQYTTNKFASTSISNNNASIENANLDITIRHAEETDCAELHSLFLNPEVMYWMANLPFTPQTNTKEILQSFNRDRQILVATSNSQILGAIVLTVNSTPRMRHIGRISYMAVRSDCQGCGIGSKLVGAAVDLADNWLNLLRLELFVFQDNEAAIKLYKKYGFQAEGKLQSFVFRAGQYVDSLLMAKICK